MDPIVPNGLFECVRAQLLAPKVLTVRVGGTICGLMGVDDPLDGLALDLLRAREPFEVELLLSPLFTPTHTEMEACESVLPLEGIGKEAQERLVTSLANEDLFCPVSYGHRAQAVPVMEVVIERYVRLLHLSLAIHPLLRPVVQAWVDDKERSVLSSLARRSVWHSEQRARLLGDVLQVMKERETFRVDKVRFLTDFVVTYRPNGKQELLHMLSSLLEAYHQDSEHPIYNQQLEHYQGGNIRSRYCGADVRSFRVAMANALIADCDPSPVMPA
ncbi:MAG: hypothetical protein HQL80_06495 [Magnetococcales bacterium]|nr:hypothetical protein [Magnetococcales bacterium]MBF0583872.1 hypothetical protein [Magnetococcales bacterium]